ncbi:endonuclease domain-containing protein [Sphingomonas sinipercae]|uniref:Endonuclease domain-containing protein n=1 Tax=Sphingomonas sinipercae TaxID=2714944 RepID=A0A6G7ZN86_9SPHN|nr:endonuclease domain-containing protein [Sphingomonas sinipercae]QIL02388.1 endonuclease domain-containing protein [Sphingomonas sinipercae]
MSLPERLLWQALRSRPGGLKFRRQHPIGHYVLDFHCPSAKLAIEVDGESHRMGDRSSRDESRDRWLAEQGLRVSRIGAADVFSDLEAVVTQVINFAKI